MVDKNLFVYLTKKSGHSLGEAAEAMRLSPPSLSKRLSGATSFRQSEMEAWMVLAGVTDAGPVFFPAFVADSQFPKVTAHG